MLISNLAVRLEKEIELDIEAMKTTNAHEADLLINKKYRAGCEVDI
ncbi:MAG: hypothetical protein JW787_13545 [Sedimentisphaerales bacterium]|nr:hypothetical protein [Sedimentisphaerales bacterium]